MAQQPSLNPALITRKGQARGVTPDEVTAPTGEPEAPVQAPQPEPAPQARGRLQTPPPPRETPPEPRQTSAGPQPRPPEVVGRININARLPVDVAEGLRVMAHHERRGKQDIVTDFIREGLDRWYAGWRELLPKE